VPGLPRLDLVAPLILVGVAGAIRLAGLGDPAEIVFDETYYVEDARAHLRDGVEDGFAVHPPLGKWLIAAGIALLGDGPVGWRIASAVAGTLVVLLTYVLADRLLADRALAVLAGVLVAVDGLLVVQSRIAMLDGLLVLFVVLGAWLLVVDRQRQDGSDHPAAAHRRPGLLLAGVAFGLAIATKWSGVLALGAALLVVFGAETGQHQRAQDASPVVGRTSRWRGSLTRAGSAGVLALVALPVAVYLASWLPWLANYERTHTGAAECRTDGELLEPCPITPRDRVAGLVRHHVEVWEFHQELDAEHPYRSEAWRWPHLGRPIVYHWEDCPPDAAAGDCEVAPGHAQEIIALGNPVLWWSALLALVPLAFGAVRRDRAALVIGAFWAAQYVPWLIVARPLFFFYMTPVVPFMALGIAYGTSWADDRWSGPGGPAWRRIGPITAVTLGVLAVGAFAFFAPVLLGWELPAEEIRRRWWFDGWV
jgi:dolichyl-phosphate-mannose-protein mannosyltransferase